MDALPYIPKSFTSFEFKLIKRDEGRKLNKKKNEVKNVFMRTDLMQFNAYYYSIDLKCVACPCVYVKVCMCVWFNIFIL